MDQRRFSENSHWYHETQTSLPSQRAALVPEAATVSDRFLLGLVPQAEGELKDVLNQTQPVQHSSGNLYQLLLPDQLDTSPIHTLTLYDRISTALTVAQVTGIQRLCNHYAARLNPLPGPDSSRESNRRLTQITEYARQLAGQPTLIDSAALQRLDDVGLSAPDIITFNHIIGFISFQARAIAGIHALMGLSIRWMPGVTVPADAESLSKDAWRPRREPLEPRYAAVDQSDAVAACLPFIQPEAFVWLLAYDGSVLRGWKNWLQVLKTHRDSAEGRLAAAVAARVNGSGSCFYRLMRGARETALEKGVDEALKVANERQKATIQLAAQLTRCPERFSAAHIQPLRDAGLTVSEVFSVILSTAAAGWENRLMQSLGSSGTAPARQSSR